MEYHRHGDLHKFIGSLIDPLKEELLLHFTSQICSALQHIHQEQVVHRDLKPENILLAGDAARPQLVVTDFGISTFLERSYLSTQAGTLPYVAPECLDRKYGMPVDMWALGCTMYAMCTRRVKGHEVRIMFKYAANPRFPGFLAEEEEVQQYSSN